MITVFTPTYNRKYTLSRLYHSLVNQIEKDFEWLIVDDGSVDQTQLLIEDFKKENKISIRYYYTENGGKQRAINKAVQLAKGELFFIVDSDDYLVPEALEEIRKEWGEVEDKMKYAGLCFRKILASTGNVLGDCFPFEKFDSDSLELTYNYKEKVDKAEVFHTSILKKFPFPEFEGENFVPEALVWFRMADTGFILRCVDKGIYICEYLADGLTQNFKLNLKRNNHSFGLFYRELLRYKQPPLWPEKLKAFVRLLQCKLYGLSQ